MVTGLDEYPGGYELDLRETAGALGLSYAPGTSNPFTRALNRCVLFGAAQPITGGLAVRRRLPPVAIRHLQRMPEHLRRAHESWRRTEVDQSQLDRALSSRRRWCRSATTSTSSSVSFSASASRRTPHSTRHDER